MRIATLLQKVFLVLLVIASGQLSAANYYLVFDSNCMDRMEYSYEETQPGNEFILYSIVVGNGEKILLEVGLESRAPIRTLNTDVLTNCEQAQQIFGSDLATKVNNKIDQIYIVTPVNMGQQFRVASVNSASYFKYDGQSIIDYSPQYRFDYFLNSNVRSDLSNGDARGSVYFVENLPLGPCQVTALRQTHGRENNYLDIYVVPEIGVVEEKSSLANTSFRLTKVNNTPFNDYVYRVCGTAATASNNTNETPSNYNESGLFAKNPYTDNNSNINTIQPAVVHTVKKGETLFRIAKQYEIDLADLKVWNNLSTDVIYPGNDLIVSTPAAMQESAQVSNYGEGLTTKGQVSGVQNYGSSDLFNTVSVNGQPAWTQTSGRHVVQAGETVLSIARLYGFTEERFRFFNNLKPTTQVRAGDLLVTSDCEEPAAGMQTKGVTNYSTVAANTTSINGYNSSSNYQYTNEQNTPYIDNYNDFDPNYPAEFQNQPQELNSANAVQNYNFPPGAMPKSPAANIQTGNVNDNFYSPSNYGPVPGSYNNNAPLSEPNNYSYPNQNLSDPTNYQNYVQPNTTQSRGAVPPNTSVKAPGTSTRPPYGGLPDNYSMPLNNTTQTKGIQETYQTNFPLTGIKKVHVVKESETLESIAARYGSSVARLRALNEMEKNEIVIPFQSIYVQK